ncbi:hypothetical protein LTR09_006386 [Extremus antarcticus]|uniref:Uncharacterized protein n=1 Tax=Extremus antarcticus TaxID=702011 RepID=A0AAJ0GDI4_9PEZI|nr:hypothetical protein LTR09_006386 [Extremus antarcticus]
MANIPTAPAAPASRPTTANTVTPNNTIDNPYKILDLTRSTPTPKIKWTVENDRKLLLLGLGKKIKASECAAIAGTFPEKPTAKAIEGRLAKLRHEQKEVLKVAQLKVPEHEVAAELDGEGGQEDEKEGGAEVGKKGGHGGDATSIDV